MAEKVEMTEIGTVDRLRIEYRQVEKVIPCARNARTYSAAQISRVSFFRTGRTDSCAKILVF